MPNSAWVFWSSCTHSGLSTHSITWPRWLTRRTRNSKCVTEISSVALASRKLIRNAHQITSTSRPKKPNTGHAPISRNTGPAAKLNAQINPISTIKPVRLSERCGVSSAENSSGCGCGSKSLPAVMTCQYIRIMAKIIRKVPPKSKPGAPKRIKKAASKSVAARARKKPIKIKPWTPAEVREAFSRFRKANPEPKGELEHLNPYTLLVAVVLSAQATDAGVNRATRSLFAVADTPQKMVDLGEDRLRDYIKTIGLYRTKAKNVIALSKKLIDDFSGEVPRTRAEIESLAGG